MGHQSENLCNQPLLYCCFLEMSEKLVYLVDTYQLSVELSQSGLPSIVKYQNSIYHLEYLLLGML